MGKVFEYLFGGAVVVSAIALIFFHVPIDQVATISVIVTLSVFLIVMIVSVITSVISALHGSGKDRYGISMPPQKTEENEDVIGCVVGPGVCSAVYAFYIAIISMIFCKQSFGNAFGLFLTFLLLGVGYAIIMFIILKVIDIIVNKAYEAKLEKVKRLEKEAHAVCDPIMLEAIEKNGVEFHDYIVTYCKEKSPKGDCRQFLGYGFFFKEGLRSLESSKKIKCQYVTSGKEDDNTYLYYTTARENDAHRTWDPLMLDIVNNSGGLLEAYQVKEELKQKCEEENLDLPNKRFVYYVNSFVANGLDLLVSEGKLVLKTPKKGDKVLRLYQAANHSESEEISLDDE